MLLPNSRAAGEAPDYDPAVTGQCLRSLLKRATRATEDGEQPSLIAAK